MPWQATLPFKPSHDTHVLPKYKELKHFERNCLFDYIECKFWIRIHFHSKVTHVRMCTCEKHAILFHHLEVVQFPWECQNRSLQTSTDSQRSQAQYLNYFSWHLNQSTWLYPFLFQCPQFYLFISKTTGRNGVQRIWNDLGFVNTYSAFHLPFEHRLMHIRFSSCYWRVYVSKSEIAAAEKTYVLSVWVRGAMFRWFPPCITSCGDIIT